MKGKVALVILAFLALAFHCFAEDKVYTNTDLERGQDNYGQAPQPQRQMSEPRVFSEHHSGIIYPKFDAGPARLGQSGYPQADPMQQRNHNASAGAPPQQAVKPRAPAPPGTVFNNMLAQAYASLTAIIALICIYFVIWLYCLIDILRSEFTGNNKIIWVLVVFFIPVVGSLLYFFMGTDQKVMQEDKEESPDRPVWPKGGW
jgi:hypothetical protein